MNVDWKYVLKRRKWSLEVIFNSLEDKGYDSFCNFFLSRCINPPKKNYYNKLKRDYDKKKKKTIKPKKNIISGSLGISDE